jgi:hypothetical protein
VSFLFSGAFTTFLHVIESDGRAVALDEVERLELVQVQRARGPWRLVERGLEKLKGYLHETSKFGRTTHSVGRQKLKLFIFCLSEANSEDVLADSKPLTLFFFFRITIKARAVQR